MNANTKKLLTAALGAGLLTAGLRVLLYRTGFDEKNILSSSHPLHLVCLALAAFMALYLFVSLRKPEDTQIDFPGKFPRSLCAAAAGFLIFLSNISLIRQAEAPISVIRSGLSLAAGCSMVLCALQSICRGIITAFFALDILCRYQSWSGNPQLPDYVFHIFACVLLSLCSYHRLALDVGLGRKRSLLWCSLMALYLSLGCISGPEPRVFFLAGGFWAASCCITEPPVQTLEEVTQ